MLIEQGKSSYMELMANNEEITESKKGTDSSFDRLFDALAKGSEEKGPEEDELAAGLILSFDHSALLDTQPDEWVAYEANAEDATSLSKIEYKGMPKGFDLSTVMSQKGFTFDTSSLDYTIGSLAVDGQDTPQQGNLDLSVDGLQAHAPNEAVNPNAAVSLLQSLTTDPSTQDPNQTVDMTKELGQETLSPELPNPSEMMTPTLPPMKHKIETMNDTSSDLELDDALLELAPPDKENLAVDKLIQTQPNHQGAVQMISKSNFQSSADSNSFLGSSNQNAATGKESAMGNYQADVGPKFVVQSSGEKANLHIHQKNIGDITASIEMDHNKSSVTLIADNHEVKQLLQSQLSQLKAIFSESNLNLVQANVEDKSSQQGQAQHDHKTQPEFESQVNGMESSKKEQGLRSRQQNTLIDTYV